jgi:hypothetical protein
MSLPKLPDDLDSDQIGLAAVALMSAKLLSSATELRLFEHLADGSRS